MSNNKESFDYNINKIVKSLKETIKTNCDGSLFNKNFLLNKIDKPILEPIKHDVCKKKKNMKANINNIKFALGLHSDNIMERKKSIQKVTGNILFKPLENEKLEMIKKKMLKIKKQINDVKKLKENNNDFNHNEIDDKESLYYNEDDYQQFVRNKLEEPPVSSTQILPKIKNKTIKIIDPRKNLNDSKKENKDDSISKIKTEERIIENYGSNGNNKDENLLKKLTNVEDQNYNSRNKINKSKIRIINTNNDKKSSNPNTIINNCNAFLYKNTNEEGSFHNFKRFKNNKNDNIAKVFNNFPYSPKITKSSNKVLNENLNDINFETINDIYNVETTLTSQRSKKDNLKVVNNNNSNQNVNTINLTNNKKIEKITDNIKKRYSLGCLKVNNTELIRNDYYPNNIDDLNNSCKKINSQINLTDKNKIISPILNKKVNISIIKSDLTKINENNVKNSVKPLNTLNDSRNEKNKSKYQFINNESELEKRKANINIVLDKIMKTNTDINVLRQSLDNSIDKLNERFDKTNNFLMPLEKKLDKNIDMKKMYKNMNGEINPSEVLLSNQLKTLSGNKYLKICEILQSNVKAKTYENKYEFVMDMLDKMDIKNQILIQ